MIGRILTFFAALAALALAAALIVPAITDWNAQRAPLEARLSEAIGAPVTLNGAVAVRLLPSPRLTASQVDLADSQARLSIEDANVRAELDLWPLLLGRVVVNRMVIADGTMRLAGDVPTLRSLADELALRLSAGQGSYRYLFAPSLLEWGTLALENPRAEIWADGPDTPVRSTLSAGSLRAEVLLRPQIDESWQLTARAVWGAELLELRFNGSLDSFAPGATMGGELAITAENLAALWGEESGPSFVVRGAWQAQGNLWRTEPLEVTLGTARAVAELQLDTHTAHFFDLALSTSLADLDALGVRIADTRVQIVGSLLGGYRSSAPQWLNGRVRIDANGLLLGARAIRESSFDFVLTEGLVELTSANAQLPGGTHLVLARRRDLARRLTVQSDNLRALLAWAGLDVDQIAGDRLQAVAVDATISEQEGPRYISLDQIRLDGGTAEGSIEEGEDGRFEITLAAADLNIDAYAAYGTSGGFLDRVRTLGAVLVEDQLSAISLSGRNIQLGGSAVDQLHLAARNVANRLIIDEARLGFAGGGSLEVRGSWAPEADMSLRVTGQAVAPMLFAGLPIVPREPADIDMTIERHNLEGALNGTLLSEGLNIDINGLDAPDGGLSGHIVARGETPGALARALGLGVFAAENAGQAEQLFIDWTGPLSGGTLTARLELPGLSVLAAGEATSPLAEDIAATLRLEGNLASAQAALSVLGGPHFEALDQLMLSAAGQLRISGGRWRFTSASVEAGSQSLVLDLSGSLSGDARLVGRVGMEALSFAAPRASEEEAIPLEDLDVAAVPQLAWSTGVFRSDWLTHANADINFEIDQLTIAGVALSDATARIGVGSGAVTVSQASAHIGPGVVTGSGTITVDGPALALSLDLAGEELPAGIIANIAGLPNVSGVLALAAHLNGRGRSPFDLVAGLEGRVDMGLTDGTLNTIAMGPFAAAVDVVRTRRALREAANAAMLSGRTGVARLTGSMSVNHGVLDLTGLNGVAETGAMSVAGSIDLRSQIVDVETVFQFDDKEVGPLSALVAFRGVNGNLSQSIDITALQQAIGPRLADTSEGLLSEEDLPEDLQELLRAYEDAIPVEEISAD